MASPQQADPDSDWYQNWRDSVRAGAADRDLSGSKNGRWAGGKFKHPLYQNYHQMIKRCHNPDHPRYASYGGRGITVCSRWREDFWAFVEDVGPRPEGKNNGRSVWSLDRIDNNGNYEPGNTRWATNQTQVLNRNSSGEDKKQRDPGTGRYTNGEIHGR